MSKEKYPCNPVVDIHGEFVIVTFPDYELTESMKDMNKYEGTVFIEFSDESSASYTAKFIVEPDHYSAVMRLTPRHLTGVIFCSRKSKDFIGAKCEITISKKVDTLNIPYWPNL